MEPTNAPAAAKAMTPVSDLFTKVWQTYKTHLKKLWPLTLATIFVAVILVFAAEFLVFFGLGLFKGNPVTFSPGIGVALYALYILALAVVTFFTVPFIQGVISLSKGTYQGIGKAYSEGVRLYWPLLLVIFGLILVFVAGEYLLLVPFIAFVVYLVFSVFEVAVEGKRGMAAFLGSWDLVRGRWWRTFGTLLLLYVVIFLICLFAEIAVAILCVLFVAIASFIGSPLVGIILAGIIGLAFIIAIITLVQPFAFVFLLELYYDMKNAGPAVPVSTGKGRKAWLIIFMVLGAIALIVMPTVIGNFSKNVQQRMMGMNGMSVADLQSFADATTTPGFQVVFFGHGLARVEYPDGWKAALQSDGNDVQITDSASQNLINASLSGINDQVLSLNDLGEDIVHTINDSTTTQVDLSSVVAKDINGREWFFLNSSTVAGLAPHSFLGAVSIISTSTGSTIYAELDLNSVNDFQTTSATFDQMVSTVRFAL